MSDKILVAYSSAAGSTAEVAEAVARAISGGNGGVDVLRTKDVKDLSPYRAVVVGTGIRAGRVYRDALTFLGRHHDALSQVHVAYFIVCMTMKDDTQESRSQVETYVDQMRARAPRVEPLGVGLFAGKMDFETLPFPLRWILKAMRQEQGDYRDWDAIKAWAAGVRPALIGADGSE
jgi:menaquinone-dependent protoporphyrinogen oxidase